MKHILAVNLLGMLLLLNGTGSLLFAAPKQLQQKDIVSSVYFTQDLSPKGLKKIYKKALGTRAGETRYKEYLPDDYLLNADDEILDEKTARLTPPELEGVVAMLQKQGAENLFPPLTARKPAVSGWHEFRYLDCLCYTSRFFDSNSVENCQRLPWFPAEQCRGIEQLLNIYERAVLEPKTMAVVSAVSVGASGAVEGGALQNMMGGNELFSPNGGNRFSPLVSIWLGRLTNLNKNTVCLNVVLKTNAEGAKTPLGVVASADCAMADQAALDLLNKEQGPLQTQKEQEYLNLWRTLVRNQAPESIWQASASKDEEKIRRQVLTFYEQKAAKSYQLVTLD